MPPPLAAPKLTHTKGGKHDHEGPYGQSVVTGVVKFSQLKNLAIPITGGSGAYRGASGHLADGAPVRGFDSVDVLHLDA